MNKAKLPLQYYRYLIIGGTTKAGTTSLFSWLRDHPEVCTASWKETRFFLDREYPLPSKYRFEDGLEKYSKYFKQCKDSHLRVEGTPDYLYSESTPIKIKTSIPDVKFIFVLREPIARLISWYRFSRQNNFIPKDFSIEEYIELNKQKSPKSQHLLALEQGRYSKYLRKYLEVFGREKVFVTFLEELSQEPIRVMKEICRFANINDDFYTDYVFKKENPTMELNHPKFFGIYRKIKFNVRKYTHDKPWIHSILRFMRLKIEPIYFSFDSKGDEKTVVPSEVLKFLCKYYTDEYNELAELIGKPIPWRLEKWLSQ